jgi:hypothetical protein
VRKQIVKSFEGSVRLQRTKILRFLPYTAHMLKLEHIKKTSPTLVLTVGQKQVITYENVKNLSNLF